MKDRHILLIVGGGIAAYKACELVRLARKTGIGVTCVLTEAGEQFVTPMSLAALSEGPVYTSLWELKDEVEMGHIELSRAADLIVVAPATADLLAKMAAGIADDLATTLLLATDAPVLAAPAMNVRMWEHGATRRNVATLREDGVNVLDPDEGEMACGEYGAGRLPEPAAILKAIEAALDGNPRKSQARFASNANPVDDAYAAMDTPLADQPDFPIDPEGPLKGRHVLVTAGPTHEPIDPVRYLANRSTGRQGFAIAAAAAEAGAKVTLVSGPVALSTPQGVHRVNVETAQEMHEAVMKALPADAAFLVAAVADWRTAETHIKKLKKAGDAPPPLELAENPDILSDLAESAQRPRLLVGFAAETGNVAAHARVKLAQKGADWIVGNDVFSGPQSAMGGDDNIVTIVTDSGIEQWERMSKIAVARALIAHAVDALADEQNGDDE